MIRAEGADRIDDPIHLPEGHSVHFLIQCVEISFDLVVVIRMIFVVTLIKDAQNRFSTK